MVTLTVGAGGVVSVVSSGVGSSVDWVGVVVDEVSAAFFLSWFLTTSATAVPPPTQSTSTMPMMVSTIGSVRDFGFGGIGGGYPGRPYGGRAYSGWSGCPGCGRSERGWS